MRWLSLFLLTSVLTLGCKDEAKPSASDDTAADTAVEDSAPAASVKTTFEDPPMPEPDPSTKPAAVEPAEAANATMETTTGVAPAAPIRDLGAELRAAVGTPVECVKDFQPSSARTIRVSVRGVVRPTGMIIEPSASGGGLSRNDLRCIEERVGAVVLSPLGGQASEPVSTVIELEYTPPEVESFEVAPPPPPAENVVPSLPKKDPIAPSGQPIDGPAPQPIEGPSGQPIEGPDAVPIKGPAPVPIGSQ